MTKELNKVQEYNRRKIICSVDVIESKFEEIKEVIKSHPNFSNIGEDQIDLLASDLDLTFTKCEITLDKVLKALREYSKEESLCVDEGGHFYQIYSLCEDGILNASWRFLWDLSKNLEDQADRVQLAIAKLLGYQD